MYSVETYQLHTMSVKCLGQLFHLRSIVGALESRLHDVVCNWIESKFYGAARPRIFV